MQIAVIVKKPNKQTRSQNKKSNSENLRRKTAMKLQLHPHHSLPLFSSKYGDIRHCCSCNMTVVHPRDLLRCMGRKTPDFRGIPQGWIYNVKIIYWTPSMAKQKFLEFYVRCHSPCTLISHTGQNDWNRFPIKAKMITMDHHGKRKCFIFFVCVLSFSLVLYIIIYFKIQKQLESCKLL